MQLTPHFTLAELTASATARRLGLDNTPPAPALAQLQRTAEMLERIRTTLGAPIIITSGYRSRAVNQAVGSASTSDHTQGMAADFVAPGYGTPYQIARLLAPMVSVLGIGQIIYERSGKSAWVHVSTMAPARPANRVITYNGSGYELGIQEAA